MKGKRHDQIRKYGKVSDLRLKTDSNEFIINEECIEIILRGKKGEEVARAIVDKSDYEKVLRHKWSLHNKGYVRTFIQTKPLYLHRYLLGLSIGNLEVDHINNDKLDNRKSNLRVCEHWVNSANRDRSRTKVLGVGKSKRNLIKKFIARIKRNKTNYHLGYFETEQEAITARLEKEKELDLIYGI